MASETEICQMGLFNIRGGTINNLTELSPQAIACAAKYPVLRDRCLRGADWGFNHKIKALAPLTTEVFGWAYAYQYPTDCLEVNRLVGSYEEVIAGTSTYISSLLDPTLRMGKSLRAPISYEVFNFDDNKVIATDTPELRISYSAKITDTNLFSEDFILALSHLLAAELAVGIVGVKEGRLLRSDSLQIYREYVDAAAAASANERHIPRSESESITVRS